MATVSLDNIIAYFPRDMATLRNYAAIALNYTKSSSKPFDLIGDNWREDIDKPIAIMWGFLPWKRAYVSQYLPDYKTAFVHGRKSWRATKKDFSKLPLDENTIFVGWSKKLPAKAKRFANKHNYQTFCMEDGFLRSFNPGALHTKPHSLVLDKTGIYFDATKSSDLENLLRRYDFSNDMALLERARTCMDVMRASNLTKYYDLTEEESAPEIKTNDDYSILVVGQVEGDASIKYGSNRKLTAEALVTQALKEHPEAKIFFRPHPDSRRSNSQRSASLNRMESLCTLLDDTVSLQQVLDKIDHVYTITSLVGMEALVRGLKVTTFGSPFYSGWGLTDDRQKNLRRDRELSIEELFAGTYLLYPLYVHPVSGIKTDYLDIASYFLVEKLKYKNIFNVPARMIDLDALRRVEDQLSSSARLALYINKTSLPGSAEMARINEISMLDFRLEDFCQSSSILLQSSNYTQHAEYYDFVVEYISANQSLLEDNHNLARQIFTQMSYCLKNANGRILNGLPNFSNWIVPKDETVKLDMELMLPYARALSYNIQYDALKTLVEAVVRHDNIPLAALSKLCNILAIRPTRSERGSGIRYQLLRKVANRLQAFSQQETPRRNQRHIQQLNVLDETKGNYESY